MRSAPAGQGEPQGLIFAANSTAMLSCRFQSALLKPVTPCGRPHPPPGPAACCDAVLPGGEIEDQEKAGTALVSIHRKPSTLISNLGAAGRKGASLVPNTN